MISLPQLRGVPPMMRDRVHVLTVLGLDALGRRRAIIEIIAQAITREDLGRDQA